MEQRANDEGLVVIDCPVCGRTTFDYDSMECIFCSHVEEMLECNDCGEMVWEDDIESVEYPNGNRDICQDCIQESAVAEIALEAHLEEN